MWSSHIFTSYQILTSFKVQLIHEPSMESPLILGRIDFTREGMFSILSKFQFGVMIKNSLHNYTVNLIKKKKTSDWWKFYTSIFVLPLCFLQLKKSSILVLLETLKNWEFYYKCLKLLFSRLNTFICLCDMIYRLFNTWSLSP